jgi:hypothetical protein
MDRIMVKFSLTTLDGSRSYQLTHTAGLGLRLGVSWAD